MDCKEGLSPTEELVGLSNNNDINDATHIAKGKRTKRLRLLSNMTSSCSSASGGSGGDDQGSFSISSTTTTTDQEEEDMANCLILLAQGGRDSHHHHHHYKHEQHQQQQQQQQNQKQQVDEDHDDHGDGNNKTEIKGRKFSEMGGTNNRNKVGFYIYECKTCNRTFPSFQALGGHRASHKKPKLAMAAEEKKRPPPSTPAPPSPPPPPPPQPQVMMNTIYDHHHHQLEFEAGERKPLIKSVPPNPISLQLGSAQKVNFNGNNKAKIHECSICGSEFTSGQALGGHMRRHRASANTSTQPMSGIEATCNATAAAGPVAVAVEVQPRNILELDLNLPAPEEDLREPKFQFTAVAAQKSMVLSAAPALVDCHY